MKTTHGVEAGSKSTTATVKDLVLCSADRIWTYSDLAELPPSAVSQALSRLARKGELRRIRKGVYYRPKQTAVGESSASSTELAATLLPKGADLRPTGTTAALILGMTTQNPAQATYAISKSNAPTKLPGVKVKVRRPVASQELSPMEAALLEFLRDRGQTGELSPDETTSRLIKKIRSQGVFPRLAKAALREPPRVRAILGALGQEAGMDESMLRMLKDSLNGLSRYDFGRLKILQYAKEWHSK